MKAAALKRQQAAQPGNTAQSHATVPALVYPPDAAWQAIRRFTPKPPYPEFQVIIPSVNEASKVPRPSQYCVC